MDQVRSELGGDSRRHPDLAQRLAGALPEPRDAPERGPPLVPALGEPLVEFRARHARPAPAANGIHVDPGYRRGRAIARHGPADVEDPVRARRRRLTAVDPHDRRVVGPMREAELQPIGGLGLEEDRLLELDLAESQRPVAEALGARRQHHLEIRGGGHDHAALDPVIGDERQRGERHDLLPDASAGDTGQLHAAAEQRVAGRRPVARWGRRGRARFDPVSLPLERIGGHRHAAPTVGLVEGRPVDVDPGGVERGQAFQHLLPVTPARPQRGHPRAGGVPKNAPADAQQGG